MTIKLTFEGSGSNRREQAVALSKTKPVSKSAHANRRTVRSAMIADSKIANGRQAIQQLITFLNRILN